MDKSTVLTKLTILELTDAQKTRAIKLISKLDKMDLLSSNPQKIDDFINRAIYLKTHPKQMKCLIYDDCPLRDHSNTECTKNCEQNYLLTINHHILLDNSELETACQLIVGTKFFSDPTMMQLINELFSTQNYEYIKYCAELINLITQNQKENNNNLYIEIIPQTNWILLMTLSVYLYGSTLIIKDLIKASEISQIESYGLQLLIFSTFLYTLSWLYNKL
ncbi:MAG: hypothetical protein KAS30_03990, partial [Candidatus Diapherotrites archaeon]|nr:hypothetical protein [Candidatus Diapherotrites archaeon]